LPHATGYKGIKAMPIINHYIFTHSPLDSEDYSKIDYFNIFGHKTSLAFSVRKIREQ